MAFLNHIENISSESQLCPIAFFAKRHPQLSAIKLGSIETSYKTLHGLICHAQAHLESQKNKENWGSGKNVAIEMQNCLEHIVLFFACIRLNANTVLLSPDEPSSMRMRKLEDMGMSTKDILAPLNWEAIADLKQDQYWSLDTAKTTLFSSGSSGKAKAITHALRSHWFSAIGSVSNIPLSSGDQWLLSLPCFHMGGLSILFRSFLTGACVVIADQKELGRLIEKHSITHCSVVARQLTRLVEESTINGKCDLSSLKHVLVGGSAVSTSLTKKAISKGLPIHLSYGSTEMASQIATTGVLDHESDLSKSGKVLPFRSLRVSDDGEIQARGECLRINAAENREQIFSLLNQNWFATGDVGRFDKDGSIIVHGRIDNMFISGGENIHPEMIENILLEGSEIDECWVLPIKSEKWGHRPIAFISPYSSSNVSNIDRLAQDRLPNFMRPDKYFELPELEVGKLKYSRKSLAVLAKTDSE